MKTAIISIVCLVACASQQEVTKKTAENDSKKVFSTINHVAGTDVARDAVAVAFKAYNLSVQPGIDAEGSVTAVTQDENGSIVLVPAKPEVTGMQVSYSQPALSLGDGNFYYYKTIYTATFKDHQIEVTKSVASEESPTRIEVPVETKILEEIAARTGGVIDQQ